MKLIFRLVGLIGIPLTLFFVWAWFLSAPTAFALVNHFTDYDIQARTVEPRGLFKYTFRDLSVSDGVHGRGALLEFETTDADFGIQSNPMALRMDAELKWPRYLIGAFFHDAGMIPQALRGLILDSEAGLVFEKGTLQCVVTPGQTHVKLVDFTSRDLQANGTIMWRENYMKELDITVTAPVGILLQAVPALAAREEKSGSTIRLGIRLKEDWLEITKDDKTFLRARWKLGSQG